MLRKLVLVLGGRVKKTGRLVISIARLRSACVRDVIVDNAEKQMMHQKAAVIR